MAFIFVTVALDMMALGIVVPVLPKLVEGFMGGDTARAAEAFGVFGIVWALMQFLFSPLLGALSDRFGRRPVILLSNAGLGLDYDRLFDDRFERRSEGPRHDVVNAAGRKRVQYRDCVRGVSILREHRTGGDKRSRADDETTAIHRIPPESRAAGVARCVSLERGQ